jgi:hypothetical protein
MYRTVLIGVVATVLCLGVTAPLVFAKQVKHGAVDICSVIDGGEVIVTNGTEVCCARVVGGTHEGQYYCVQCDPPGSDNCEEFTETKAPNDRLLTILVTTILAGQREIRNELDNLPAKIKELCAPAPPSNR